ncbi:MAG: hypothetical protein ACRD0P_15495 [Stackebrandtia sp.]
MTAATATRLPAWLVLAGMELRLILRNRSIAITAIVMPLGFASVVLFAADLDPAGMASMNVLMLAGFTVYMTVTMTLAHHRASLFLKRVRSSPASTGGIVLGFSSAPMLLFLGQALLVITVTCVAESTVPKRGDVLVLAGLLGAITCAALGFLTASFTKTPEAAQYTTVPGFAVIFGSLMWIITTPADEVTPLMMAMPGAGVTQLLRYGWSGEGATDISLAWPAFGSVAVAVVACAVAARLFRWEPRS